MAQYRDDSADLARRLEEDMEAVLNEYWPGWIKTKVKSVDKALLTPKMKPKQKRPTSSFTLDLSGSRRGQWYRFSQGVGGGMLSLLYYGKYGQVPNSKSDWADAYKLAREFLGISQEREESDQERAEREKRRDRERGEREERDRREAAEKARREAARAMNAQQVWESASALTGSQGEAYLMARGLPPVASWPWDCSDTIRFHPSLDFEKDRSVGRFPAVVARVQDAFGETIAVWQIYLAHGKPEKADLSPSPKIGRGPAAGGAVRIGGQADRIGGAEGLETSVALWALEGFRKPIWSFLSTSGMRSFEPPMFVKHVSIYPDGDKGLLHKQTGKILPPPGGDAATALFEKMKSIGVGSNINEMTILGDGLDLLQTRNTHDKR